MSLKASLKRGFHKKMKNKKAKLFDIKHFPMDFARILCLPLPLWFRIKRIYASDTAKKKIRGGALIASNHTSCADPLMLGCTFWYRRMFFLAAEVVMKNPIIGFLLKGVGCIEITRDACDMNALRQTVDILKAGHTMAVFPQGKIDVNDDVNSIKSGIVLMALMANVPIVPIYMAKRQGFLSRSTVIIGDAIMPPSSKGIPSMSDIQQISNTLTEKMAQCKAIYEQKRSKK